MYMVVITSFHLQNAETETDKAHCETLSTSNQNAIIYSYRALLKTGFGLFKTAYLRIIKHNYECCNLVLGFPSPTLMKQI